MSESVVLYALIALFGVFVSAISQVMLKKSALKTHDSHLREYLNPLVVFAYALFVASTLLSTLAFRVIPLSMGPILDATGYVYVTAFGVLLFRERLNRRKVLALVLILAGIAIYSFGV
ncbi:SMR family transporter [Gordonibacter massiliensis (ex Traore et al. 2017)]|uniref:SMR family transporter n=1 Tax=Gordonibacter massiliensis (ex Traore et al. 2017) TaxID=1841863 RepID=UPI001C8BC348|nr:SMR family transporter [Gordonibacter massiliensis (ex Traore et al. 2017)]MBX9033624.1 multidrug ABC transporter [Gordonibacter massiliensis (ex Traore et al. 2017)]